MRARSDRPGSHRGQTSAAYLGMIVVVSVITAALVTTDVPVAIDSGLERAVCTISSFAGDGGDCGDSGSSDDPGSDDPDNPESDDPDDPGFDDPDNPPLTPREQAEAGDYVAIGDSFSSGEGAYDYDPDTDTDDNRCHRSDNAYPAQIGDEFDFEGDVRIVTCSGARARNAGETEEHGEAEGQYGEDPQLEAITDDTSLVTIGIGGNDAEWTGVVIDCISDLNSNCQDSEDQVQQNMEDAADAVLEIYLQARERAPDDARVVAVGYPRFFPEPPDGDLFRFDIGCVNNPTPFGQDDYCAKRVGLTPEEQAWMNERFGEFNDLLAERAEQAGIEFVDMYDAFDGHEYGTEDPYMNELVTDWPDWDECGFSTEEIKDCLETAIQSETAHPNAAGQEAMAELVAEQVESGG